MVVLVHASQLTSRLNFIYLLDWGTPRYSHRNFLPVRC
uniref:Uncharacterized protein n=1 Tax=Rhizophora mucronata TaxID=61149 RepID=A0A2P2NT53_RHIMU